MAGGMRDPDKALKFWTPGRLARRRCSPTSTSTCRSTSSRSAPRARCSAPARCRSSTRRSASCARSTAGPTSTSTSPAASAPRAARARGGSSRSSAASSTGRASEEDLDKLLDICDNILGRSFCALGRRRDEPDHQLDPVLPRRVRRPPHARRLPVRPEGVDAVRQGRRRTACPHDDHAPRRSTGAAAPPAPAQAADLVTLTIDDREVSVPKGTLIIRAAETVGIEIPRFCDHPRPRPGRRLPPVPRRGRGCRVAPVPTAAR